MNYIPSHLLGGDKEQMRDLSFTRWMSKDLRQAATDFCKNIGLIAIYAETSKEGLTRYLFWRLPKGAMVEVRSGRAYENFVGFDIANGRELPLLTLHVSEVGIYSGVWLSASDHADAEKFLMMYGITVAERRED